MSLNASAGWTFLPEFAVKIALFVLCGPKINEKEAGDGFVCKANTLRHNCDIIASAQPPFLTCSLKVTLFKLLKGCFFGLYVFFTL